MVAAELEARLALGEIEIAYGEAAAEARFFRRSKETPLARAQLTAREAARAKSGREAPRNARFRPAG